MGYGGSSGRLRGELTEFVGRRAEPALVRQTLVASRLVTLTGPGGIGKTRLALRAADGARRAFRDGAWLAELGVLRDPALLVPEVARSLGLSDQSGHWPLAILSDYLQARQVLLVVDQCEHLADACAVMADALLRACPELRIIATSRHVLGVTGEATVAVPPMTVPAEVGPAGPEELLGYEAVRLFAGRAAAVLPGFMVDAGNGPAVAGVCRALDGIPLAIELAAVTVAGSELVAAGLPVPAAVGRRASGSAAPPDLAGPHTRPGTRRAQPGARQCLDRGLIQNTAGRRLSPKKPWNER